MSTQVVKSQRSESRNTPEIRIAFPYIHEKRTKNAGGLPLKSPRNDAVLMFKKLHTEAASCPNYKFLTDLLMEAAGKMWPGIGWPQGGLWPIKDGDVPYVAKPKPGVTPKTPEQIAAANAWRVGYWIVEASHHLDPGPRVAIMQNGQVVEIPARTVNGVTYYKSGDYAIANIHAYAFQNDQWGANIGLDGVLWTREGDAIGSSGPRSAEQMFGDVASVAPPGTAPAAPVAPAPPGTAPVAPAAPSALPPFPGAPPQ